MCDKLFPEHGRQFGIQRRALDAGSDMPGNIAAAPEHGDKYRAPAVVSAILAQGKAVFVRQYVTRMEGIRRKVPVGKDDVSLRVQRGQRHSGRIRGVDQQLVQPPVAFRLFPEADARGDIQPQVVCGHTGGGLHVAPYFSAQGREQQGVVDEQTAHEYDEPPGQGRGVRAMYLVVPGLGCGCFFCRHFSIPAAFSAAWNASAVESVPGCGAAGVAAALTDGLGRQKASMVISSDCGSSPR